MKGFIRAGPRLFAAAVGAVALAASAQPSSAQSVFFSGFTRGCFYNTATSSSCTPVDNSSVAGGALSFVGSTFGGTTTNGVLAFDPSTWWTHTGNAASAGGLGTMTLGKLPGFTYTGWHFVMQVVFVHPASHTNMFLAVLDGVITHSKPFLFGDVDIAFGGPQSWGPNGKYGVEVGSFSNLLPEQSHTFGGQMTTSTPEPITMILFGTGLAGVGLARRRRAKLQQADLI